jgi:hypothetical protein
MYKGSMMYHPWTKDITNTISLSFLVNVHQVNHLKEDFIKAKIKAKLQKEASWPEYQTPLCMVDMSSPSHTHNAV